MERDAAMEVYRLIRRRFPDNTIPGPVSWEGINWAQNLKQEWYRITPELHKLTVHEDSITLESPKGTHRMRVQKPNREYFYGVPVVFEEKDAD